MTLLVSLTACSALRRTVVVREPVPVQVDTPPPPTCADGPPVRFVRCGDAYCVDADGARRLIERLQADADCRAAWAAWADVVCRLPNVRCGDAKGQ